MMMKIVISTRKNQDGSRTKHRPTGEFGENSDVFPKTSVVVAVIRSQVVRVDG
jgi:hypothetical protein